ncbi:hypothetical protein [Castellaniella sp. UC4442_H9]|nr:hypothetical protein [Castellaniella sp.]
MIYTSAHQSILLSDALERAYSSVLLNAPHPLPISQGIKVLGRGLRRAVRATGHFVADAINAQAEARSRDQRYSRTPW